jgi:hypothetical protein
MRRDQTEMQERTKIGNVGVTAEEYVFRQPGPDSTA